MTAIGYHWQKVALRNLGCPPMNRSDECCRFGAECLKLARAAEDETNRAVYLHMARVWLTLAQEEVRTTLRPMFEESQIMGTKI